MELPWCANFHNNDDDDDDDDDDNNITHRDI